VRGAEVRNRNSGALCEVRNRAPDGAEVRGAEPASRCGCPPLENIPAYVCCKRVVKRLQRCIRIYQSAWDLNCGSLAHEAHALTVTIRHAKFLIYFILKFFYILLLTNT